MFRNFVIYLTESLLRKTDLSIQDSARLTGAVLERVGALPYTEIFKVGAEHELLINGKPISPEQAMSIRDGAAMLVDNKVLMLVLEHILYQAVTVSVHNAQTVEQVYFGRAAIWWAQNIRRTLNELAQKGDSMV